MADLAYFRRGPPALGFYELPQADLDSLKTGQTVSLREGSQATFLRVEDTPQGKKAVVQLPDGISLVKADELAMTADSDTASGWWIARAEQLAPQGAKAVMLMSPVGALTEGGALLRAIDAARAATDPVQRLLLAGRALRLAKAYAKSTPSKPAPLPSERASKTDTTSKTTPGKKEDTTDDQTPKASTPWGLIGGGVLLGLMILGSGDEVEDDDDDDEED